MRFRSPDIDARSKEKIDAAASLVWLIAYFVVKDSTGFAWYWVVGIIVGWTLLDAVVAGVAKGIRN